MDGFIRCNLVHDDYGRELINLPTGNGIHPPLKVDESFLIHNSNNGHVLMQVFVIETVDDMVRVSVPSASLGIDSKIWLSRDIVQISDS